MTQMYTQIKTALVEGGKNKKQDMKKQGGRGKQNGGDEKSQLFHLPERLNSAHGIGNSGVP